MLVALLAILVVTGWGWRHAGALALGAIGVAWIRRGRRRPFQQELTTKSFGHGYGMHSSAIVACNMGGSLTAGSDRPGLGATMTLEIPIKPEEEVQRAA